MSETEGTDVFAGSHRLCRQLRRRPVPAAAQGEWRVPGAISARLRFMAFGQPSGPPASAKQVQELLTLLREAGHSDFRDARGPMGFTQRQAAGKFTRDEAEAFLDRLSSDGTGGDSPEPAATPVKAPRAVTTRTARAPSVAAVPDPEQAIRQMPAEQLAAELRRRGWTVAGPEAER